MSKVNDKEFQSYSKKRLENSLKHRKKFITKNSEFYSELKIELSQSETRLIFGESESLREKLNSWEETNENELKVTLETKNTLVIEDFKYFLKDTMQPPSPFSIYTRKNPLVEDRGV